MHKTDIATLQGCWYILKFSIATLFRRRFRHIFYMSNNNTNTTILTIPLRNTINKGKLREKYKLHTDIFFIFLIFLSHISKVKLPFIFVIEIATLVIQIGFYHNILNMYVLSDLLYFLLHIEAFISRYLLIMPRLISPEICIFDYFDALFLFPLLFIFI